METKSESLEIRKMVTKTWCGEENGKEMFFSEEKRLKKENSSKLMVKAFCIKYRKENNEEYSKKAI